MAMKGVCKPANCTCDFNFTCRLCLNRVVYVFTPSTSAEIMQRQIYAVTKETKKQNRKV